MNQGYFVLMDIEQMTDAEVKFIFKDVTTLYVEAASGISHIISEKYLMN